MISSEKMEKLLLKWDHELEAAEELFKIEGRKINEVAREHSQHLFKFEKLLYEVRRYEEMMVVDVEVAEAAAWKKYTEGYSVRLSATDIRAYVSGEADVVAAKQLKIEISTIRHQVEAVVDAIKNMGWMLSHLTKLYIEQLETSTI